MSWWNAKYKNDFGEYEITFGSKDYEKTRAVERVCQAIIDKRIKTQDDLRPLLVGWISVEDALPEGGGSVLIYSPLGGVAEGTYSKHYKRWVQYRWSVFEPEVTHWMPLPAPPKEEV